MEVDCCHFNDQRERDRENVEELEDKRLTKQAIISTMNRCYCIKKFLIVFFFHVDSKELSHIKFNRKMEPSVSHQLIANKTIPSFSLFLSKSLFGYLCVRVCARVRAYVCVCA